jgi:cytochrome b involved in lipid metabolism
MNKLPLAILLIILVRAFFLINQSKEVMVEEPQMIQEEEMASDSAKVTSDRVYSIEEIAKHTSEDDCWFVIDGIVYDVSNFGETHKGEEAVYQGCGIDASELFETRPMGSETPHSEEAREFLPNFEIGVLATE